MGTVNVNIKGLVGHKGGYSIKEGIEFPVLKSFKGGGDCLINYGDISYRGM